MTLNLKKVFVLGTLLFVSSLGSYAAEQTEPTPTAPIGEVLTPGATNRTSPPASELSASEKLEAARLAGPWVFMGFDFGFAGVSTSAFSEIGKSGYHFEIKGVAAFYQPRWVFDFGVGYFSDNISSTGTFQSVRVITNGLMLEVSPRYRLGQAWQLGPVVNLLFSTDASFSENPNDSSLLSLLGGARVQYELPLSENILRLGAQAMTSIGIGSRNLWTVQGDIQFGFPFNAPKPATIYVYGPAKAYEEAHSVTVNLDEKHILFETNKSVIRKPYQANLEKFSQFLVQNAAIWDAVRIEGHTDSRGKADHNIALSFARATAVGTYLIKAGIPSAKIEVKGLGASQPLDPGNDEAAWQKNRRVVIKITGVEDPAKMSQDINAIWPEEK